MLVGLSLWSNIVVAPYILTSGMLLLIFCRKEIRSWSPILLIAGLLIGGFPLIIYNLHATLATNSLATAMGMFSGGVSGHSRLYFFVHGTLGVLLIGLPAIIGDSTLCNASQTFLFGGSGPGAMQCTVSQSLWSLVWLALWVSSVYLSLKTIWAMSRKMKARTPEQQQELARSSARLGLLIAAALALLLFAFSSSSTYFPFLSSRYILFIWIATPALLYPLWRGASARQKPAALLARLIAADSKRLVLLFIVLFLLWGTVKTFHEIPGVQATITQQANLISNLKRIGAVHIYSDYWTCDSLIFESDEQIICDTVDANLNQGYVRYPPDAAIVQSDPKASYVFPLGLPQVQTIARRAAQPGNHYHRYIFDGYVVYQPA
jgi:hypothetical protein